MSGSQRETTQHLLPLRKPTRPPGASADAYDIFPTYPLEETIYVGFGALADRLVDDEAAMLDGYLGVFWEDVRSRLDAELSARGVRAHWLDVASAMRPHAEIEALVRPYLGGSDPLFGTKCPLDLTDLFDRAALRTLAPQDDADLTIVYGCGAALAGWDADLVYVDIPKNELQYRSRAGSVRNLGAETAVDAKPMYKRFYFVDWPMLNRHKRDVLPRVDWMVDGQRPHQPTFARGAAVRDGLSRMSQSHVRARPWFEPGAWGGRWIRDRIPGLATDVPNYAWSFELITPENGVLFEHDGVMLELSFDCLMFHAGEAVLGRAWPRFGDEFPIRFDLLDTVGGGNLSLQCHPRPGYIREHFGERMTQDETYYILDCEPGAEVFLGFREGIDPGAFREALERSLRDGAPVDVEAFVHVEPSERHRLFLIPSGTIHSSGRGNLVLEISATPYIFTFKLYDWLRLGLDGRPRPINIERGFDNLAFDRTARIVRDELVSRPTVVATGADWKVERLPTHPEHFYAVRRYTFTNDVQIENDGACHVMCLVDGDRIRLVTEGGPPAEFHFAETFLVPAATRGYRLVNESAGPATVVQAYVKDEA